MIGKVITDGELSHLKSVLRHCKEEFEALEDDGCFCDVDGTYQQIKEALDIIHPLLKKEADAE